MLETRGLVKIYRPKKGVPVKALDGVSLKFPDKGMIFLLGKSGSGKSTLLNVLGGLDKYDGGEIIIKEVSSKDFKQQHFDSYRNTYVGFIFQEYNILEEFTVGANIALALELQGRKATDGEINRILREVDLDGYGNRRPNELSGGQKQRVAIARALVKNPKIIMADEPSGALDSATGKQVFETLKKLSKEKLVIVVSHDRDFASEYADRIIELADGKVISDTTLCEETEDASVGIAFEGAVARIPLGYRLTEEDRIAINEYIEKLQSGAELEFINKTASKKFAPTEQDKIKNEDKAPFKLIKSKLSLKHAFKIGSGGLKHKKFRLVMTVILSCIAFILFGLVDTFSSYNHINACTDSIYDSKVTYASLVKSVKYGEGLDSYWNSWAPKITDEDLTSLKNDTGVDFKGVVSDNAGDFSFRHNTDYSKFSNLEGYGSQLYAVSFSGIVEINEDDMEKLGYSVVAGHLPNGAKNEIAISKYVCDTFIKGGFRSIYDETYAEIKTYSDMVGRVFNFNGTDYTVSGVIDTNLDWDRYTTLLEDDIDDDTAEMLLKYALYSEFNSAVENNFTGLAMVGEGGLETFLENRLYMNGDMGSIYFFDEEGSIYLYSGYVNILSNIDRGNIEWLDGKERTVLGEKEILVTSDVIEYCFPVEYIEDMTEFEYDKEKVLNTVLQGYAYSYVDYSIEESAGEDGYRIVGVINNNSELYDTVIINDELFARYFSVDGEYDYALGAMPEGKGGIKELVAYCYDEEDNVRFELQNPACFELDAMHEVILVLSDIFLYVGIGFAVFAAILLSNFIATSISYKKQEIGILRAIGSRGNDVFRIFFAEAFIIAMINFVLACLGTGAIVAFINSLLRAEVGLLVTFLNFGIRQIALLFVISVAVAAIASFLPVKKIASKKPIDAIRNR